MVKRLQFPNHRGELFIVFLSYWLPLAILFTLYSYMYHNKYLLVPNKMTTSHLASRLPILHGCLYTSIFVGQPLILL